MSENLPEWKEPSGLLKMLCPKCKSRNIVSPVLCAWDPQIQKYVATTLRLSTAPCRCNDCNASFDNPDIVELQPLPKPDLKQCEGQRKIGGFIDGKMERCNKEPEVLCTEIHPNEDGRMRSFALCKGCREVMVATMGGDYVSTKPIGPRMWGPEKRTKPASTLLSVKD